jgi:hypothetical protein
VSAVRNQLHNFNKMTVIICLVMTVTRVYSKRLFVLFFLIVDRLCGLVVRVLDYRSGGPVSIPGTTRKKVVGLERGALSLVSTTEELLDRKVASPV